MHTLFIKTETELKYYLLNTNLPDDFVEERINDLLDRNEGCEWWMEEGYHIKHTPLY